MYTHVSLKFRGVHSFNNHTLNCFRMCFYICLYLFTPTHRYLIEEFHTYNSMNQCLSLSDHINIHDLFQNKASIENYSNESGLQHCLGIALQGFSATSTVFMESYCDFQQAMESNASYMTQYVLQLQQQCTCLNEASKLLLEVLCWEFTVNVDDKRSNKSANDESQFDKKTIELPAVWQEHFVNGPLLANICKSYEICRAVYLYCSCQLYQHRRNNTQATADFSSVSSNIRCCFITLRNLINCFVSMKRVDKINYCRSVLSLVVTPCMHRIATSAEFYNSIDFSGSVDQTNASAVSIAMGIVKTNSYIQQHCNGSTIPLIAQHLMSLQSEEYEHASALLKSLLANNATIDLLSIPEFSQVMLYVSQLTNSISEEISDMSMRKCELKLSSMISGANTTNMIDLSNMLLPQLYQPQGNSSRYDAEIHENGLVESNCSVLLETWRGDVMGQLLESWSRLLEHDDLLLYTSILNDADASKPVVDNSLKMDLKRITGVIFTNLFKCLLSNSVCDGYACEEEEEDLEEEAIYNVNFKDLLVDICTLGRYSYKVCISLLLEQLQRITSVYTQLQNSNPNQKSVDTALEVMRITVLCITHMTSPPSYETDTTSAEADANLNSAYHSILMSSTTSSLVSSEVPMIPYCILDMLIWDTQNRVEYPHSIPCLHKQLFNTLFPGILMHSAQLLQNYQTHYLMISPMLFETFLQFLNHYAVMYVSCASIGQGSGCDSTYNTSIMQHCQALLNNHANSDDVLNTIELCLQFIYLVVCTCPQEASLIRSGFATINTFAKLPLTRNILLQSKAFQQIVGLFTNATCAAPEPQLRSVFYRLPIEGMQLHVDCIATAAIRAKNVELFQVICQGVYTKMIQVSHSLGCCGGDGVLVDQSNAPPVTANPSIIRDMEALLMYLYGLSRLQFSSNGINLQQRDMLHQLLDSALSHCYAIVVKCATVLQFDIDAAFVYYLAFLRDYAEYQLSSLTPIYTLNLYKVIENSYPLIKKRLKLSTGGSTTSRQNDNNEVFESSYSADIFLIVLQILNHLTTRDFMLSEADEQMTQKEIEIFDSIVVNTLFSGLDLVFNYVTTPMLLNYPHVNLKYINFIQLLLSWYEKHMLEYVGCTSQHLLDLSLVPNVNTCSNAVAMNSRLGILCTQLLWCIGNCFDFSVIRISLDILSSLAVGYSNHCLDIHSKLMRMQHVGSGTVPAYFQAQCTHLQRTHDITVSTYLQVLTQLFYTVVKPNTTATNAEKSDSVNSIAGISIEIPVTCSITVTKCDAFAGAMYMLLVLIHTVHSETFYQLLHIPCPNADNSPYGIQLFINNITLMLQSITQNSTNTVDLHAARNVSTAQLIHLFQQLLSNRGLDYSKGISNRSMRTNFVQNMKEFLTNAKPLLTYD